LAETKLPWLRVWHKRRPQGAEMYCHTFSVRLFSVGVFWHLFQSIYLIVSFIFHVEVEQLEAPSKRLDYKSYDRASELQIPKSGFDKDYKSHDRASELQIPKSGNLTNSLRKIFHQALSFCLV
jgi:hypothetical protein